MSDEPTGTTTERPASGDPAGGGDASTDAVDVPADVAAVADRYLRRERPVSYGFVLTVGSLAAVAIVTLPLVYGLLAAGLLVVLVRLPVLRVRGRARLRTDAAPQAVYDEFTGPLPPVLGLQWGLADEVRRTTAGAAYDISYLFGRRSMTMHTMVYQGRTGDETEDEWPASLELEATEGDRSWGTYDVTIDESSDGTVVEVRWHSDRRFGLRRLPQWFVGRRYRNAALAEQGYAVSDSESSITL